MKQRSRNLFYALSGLIVAMAVGAAGGDSQSQTQPDELPVNPAVEKFYDPLVFYAGFEENAYAEITPGDAAPIDASWKAWSAKKAEIYRPGVLGKAIESGGFMLTYDLGAQATLEQTGSAAAWVSATDWKRANADPGNFFIVILTAGNRNIRLGRMGNPVNNETLYANYQANRKGVSVTGGNTSQWKDQEWHLVIMNWGPNWIEYSLDGAEPMRRSLDQQVPFSNKPGARLTISTPREVDMFLMDEVFVFSRPLNGDEIRWFYESRGGSRVQK